MKSPDKVFVIIISAVLFLCGFFMLWNGLEFYNLAENGHKKNAKKNRIQAENYLDKKLTNFKFKIGEVLNSFDESAEKALLDSNMLLLQSNTIKAYSRLGKYDFSSMKLNVRNFEGRVVNSLTSDDAGIMPKEKDLKKELCLQEYSEFCKIEKGFYFRYVYPFFYRNTYAGSFEVIICVDELAKQLEELFDIKICGYVLDQNSHLEKMLSCSFVPFVRGGKSLFDVGFASLNESSQSITINFEDDYYIIYRVGGLFNKGKTIKTDFLIADIITDAYEENFIFFIQYTLISGIMLIVGYFTLRLGNRFYTKKNDSEKKELIEVIENKSKELLQTNKNLSCKIADYKNKEKALFKSEERLGFALKEGNLVMWDWDGRSDEVMVNDLIYDVLGYAKGDLKFNKENWLALIHPDDIEKIRKKIDLYKSGKGSTHRVEYRLKKKDGKWVWVSMISFLTEADASGRPLRLSGVISDITQRKRIVDKLKTTLQRQEAIFENSLVSIAYLVDGITIKVNKTFLDTFGFDREEIIGNSLEDLKICTESECYLFLQNFNYLKVDDSINQKYQISKKDGTLIWCHISGRAIKSDNAEKGVIVVFEEITDYVKAEKDLEKARIIAEIAKETADNSNKIKGQFIANMSHEIRTPLNGIMGMAELISLTELNRYQQEYVSAIKTSADNLLDIVNDILDFSKMQSNKMKMESIDINLRELVENTAHLAAYKIYDKKLELLCFVDPEIPEFVMGDPLRIRQVLLNLLSNAIKFTVEGEIYVYAGIKEVMKDKLELYFYVSDTGMGIPENKIDALFHEFCQVDGSTTRKYGGTGLGLAISSQLVTMMGGSLSVRSKENEGSVFDFNIMVQASKKVSPFNSDREKIKESDLHVLIVDDNKSSNDIVKSILDQLSLKSDIVDNISEALNEIYEKKNHDQPFDLILLDSYLPAADGFDLVTMMKENVNLREIPVVMMLSYSAIDSQIELCKKLGNVEYIKKPIRKSELENIFYSVITGNCSFDGFQKKEVQIKEKLSDALVLLVEDNIINRKVAEEILQSRGYRVISAQNGKEATEKFISTPGIDIILMDIQMPVMNGYEATRIIREYQQEKGGGVPIMAMTANVMKGDRERCFLVGMDDYIAKPINNIELFDKIESLLKEIKDKNRAIETTEIKVPVPAFTPTKGKKDDNSSSELLDMPTVEKRLGLDRDIIVSIISDFFKLLPDEISEMRRVVKEDKRDECGKIAHKLKGQILNLGIGNGLQEIKKLELESKSMASSPIFETIDVVEDKLRIAEDYFIKNFLTDSVVV